MKKKKKKQQYSFINAAEYKSDKNIQYILPLYLLFGLLHVPVWLKKKAVSQIFKHRKILLKTKPYTKSRVAYFFENAIGIPSWIFSDNKSFISSLLFPELKFLKIFSFVWSLVSALYLKSVKIHAIENATINILGRYLS